MPSIDIEKFLTQSGVRKTRFGGFDEDDVRAAMRTLCAEYDQRLNHVQNEWRRLSQENASLVQQCRTLAGQNRVLSSQNATLAGNGEQYSRQSQELSTEVNRLQERNRSLNDQCAVLRLKNNDLKDENATLKADAEQAEAALRLRGKELADEIAALRASRQQKLNEAAAEANATLTDARKQADALLAEARAQAEAIAQAARQQARAQAQNLVDAAAAEANEIQNAHQLRLNELAAEVRRMEARRERMIEYFNQVGNELLRTGATAEGIDITPPQTEAPAELPEDFLLPEIPAPVAELDFSPAALAAAQNPTPEPPKAPEVPSFADSTPAAVRSPAEQALPPQAEASAAPPARRSFDLVAEETPAVDPAPVAPAPSVPEPTAPAAPTVPTTAFEPAAPADDADWRDLTLDPAPAQDPLAAPAALWPDLAPEAPTQPGPQPVSGGSWPARDTLQQVAPAAPADTPWKDIGFEDVPAAAAAGAELWQDLDPITPGEADPWAGLPDPAAGTAPAPAPAADFDIRIPAAAPDAGLWQDLPPVSPSAPAAQAPAAAPKTAPAPVPAAAPQDTDARQTVPGPTEVPGAIFSSPIVHQVQATPAPGSAPAAAPRAPLLPVQEMEVVEEEDTVSGLVAKPAAPGAGVAWQRRHKAIRAIQALRRLYS